MAIPQHQWYLPPSDFIGRMSPTDWSGLLALGHAHEFRKGDHVFRSGAPGGNVYLLEHGRAKIYKLSGTGKEVILWFCFPGEMFGLAEVSRGGARDVYAQVCTDARVHAIRREDFVTFLETRPHVAVQMIDVLACRMRTLGEMMLNLVTDDVESRVAKLLIRLCACYGQHSDHCVVLDIPLTHQEMADMIGTTRQTVTSVLNGLKRQGVLRVERHHILVEQERLLERLTSAG